ncbi:MAG: ArsR family transcriptional regulator [Anaerolineae bacterium]|nr:ArsR family transcriptional regulator [Anaerolineae bacterium]
MQKTRERIVNILKMRGESTVEALSEELGLTSVTVRHHMEILRNEGIVDAPESLRREQPGRPQYLYRLADGAEELFPSNYDVLAVSLLREMTDVLPAEEVEQVIRRIAAEIAAGADVPRDADFATRLEAVVRFLDQQGYMVSREDADGRIELHFHNCPYNRIVHKRREVCAIDAHMLALLFPAGISREVSVSDGESHCVYVLSVDAAGQPAEETGA